MHQPREERPLQRALGFLGVGDGREVSRTDHQWTHGDHTGPEGSGGPGGYFWGVGDHQEIGGNAQAVVLTGVVEQPGERLVLVLGELDLDGEGGEGLALPRTTELEAEVGPKRRDLALRGLSAAEPKLDREVAELLLQRGDQEL